ncbi:glutamate 5-kinase [Sphingosinicella sp. BN140058]|uniref:glutamate 5-kinase n=1 Tax=Sphingosinicella sp. BN140058 TaxID=1892855 RepID=UPI0010138491|nr:glutamate 5-kinase [Sphingosinicella sp. BN140058]QAY76843.1 glutamate 5-kinase [Sphingosinicella sp. BN140058]
MSAQTLSKPLDATRLIADARRITVKVGSSLLIDSGREDVRRAWLRTLGADLAALRNGGKQLVVVSSGAVALGRGKLGLKRSARLDIKQAAAAAGQPRLMAAWDEAMGEAGIPTAQLLLTVEDTESRRRWLNARATIEVLLAEGALPVVNENDSVATEELRYGDNDRLSARVAQMVRSDVLILLSDVDGLYTADPSRDPAAEHLPLVEEIDARIEGFAGGAGSAGVGTGGMRTKIAAARIARGVGCATIIAKGQDPHPLRALGDGARATVIAACGSPAGAYKQWIAGTLTPAGALVIDAGAVRALLGGKSLLPAGVRRVDGEFERGVCLRVLDPDGREVARGLTAYTSAEAGAVQGYVSTLIADRLGYAGPDEIIHRDDLVLM